MKGNDMRHFRLIWNGKVYEFDAEEIGGSEPVVTSVSNVTAAEPVVQTKAPAEVVPASSPAVSSSSGSEVLAPLAGRIFDIVVKPGDSVQEGDVVVVMDAMKMEVPVYAVSDGVIKSIEVKKGDLMETDQVIAIIG